MWLCFPLYIVSMHYQQYVRSMSGPMTEMWGGNRVLSGIADYARMTVSGIRYSQIYKGSYERFNREILSNGLIFFHRPMTQLENE